MRGIENGSDLEGVPNLSWKDKDGVAHHNNLSWVPSDLDDIVPGLMAYLAPVLWLAVPVFLILELGLFKGAYLKFLLVASPAFCLLTGRLVTTVHATGRHTFSVAGVLLGALVSLLLVGASGHGLYHYYNNPAHARDDYPERDDDNWLKHTLCFKDGTGYRLDYKPVTLGRYEPKPRVY